MTYEYPLPDVGEGISEAELVAWKVEPGEYVEEGMPVADVETDKSIVEVTTPVSGEVSELKAEVGDKIQVDSVFITFNQENSEEAEQSTVANDGDETSESSGATGPQKPVATPSTRRLARELGVSLDELEGSGTGGKILKEDVREASSSGEDNNPETTEEDTVKDKEEKVLAAPATRRTARDHEVSLSEVPTEETKDGHSYVTPEALEAYLESDKTSSVESSMENIPYRGIRETIGSRMLKSSNEVAHVTHQDKAVAPKLAEVKETLDEESPEDLSITYTAIIVKAVVAALENHPRFNAELDKNNEEIVLKDNYNIGVATDTDQGLMVPVVENVDDKNIQEIAEEIEELSRKARNKEITSDELTGGTFTVTNIGVLGGEYATPLVNYPEVGILAVGEIKEDAVVEDGEVVPRTVVPLSLSFDHQVADGADAARFVNGIKKRLQNPELLLLE